MGLERQKKNRGGKKKDWGKAKSTLQENRRGEKHQKPRSVERRKTTMFQRGTHHEVEGQGSKEK